MRLLNKCNEIIGKAQPWHRMVRIPQITEKRTKGPVWRRNWCHPLKTTPYRLTLVKLHQFVSTHRANAQVGLMEGETGKIKLFEGLSEQLIKWFIRCFLLCGSCACCAVGYCFESGEFNEVHEWRNLSVMLSTSKDKVPWIFQITFVRMQTCTD